MIRNYRISDYQHVERILRIGLHELESHAAGCVPPEDVEYFDTQFEEHMFSLEANPQDWYVITGTTDVVLGCMWLKHLDDTLGPYLSVRELVVDPLYRDQGLGRLLLDFALKRTDEPPPVMILISAFASNPALRMYRRAGFEDFPDRYKKDTNPNHTVLWIDLRASS